MTCFSYKDLVDWQKVDQVRQNLRHGKGLIIVYGYAASLVEEEPDLLIYADMARWEIQRRQRLHEVDNIGLCNREEDPARQYKRGFFLDWRICDRQKNNFSIKQISGWIPIRKILLK